MSIKTLSKWLAFGVVLVFAIIFLSRSCRLTDRYSELRGAYNTLKERAEIDKKELTQTIMDNELRQRELDEVITGLEKKVAEKNKKIGQLTNEIGQLEGEFEALPTLEEKITNLQRQVSLWKDNFSLAQGIITDKDQEIFSMKEKYNQQLTVIEVYKKNYNGEVRLREMAELRIEMAEKKLRSSKTWNTVKTMAIVALAGGLAYQLIRGGK